MRTTGTSAIVVLAKPFRTDMSFATPEEYAAAAASSAKATVSRRIHFRRTTAINSSQVMVSRCVIIAILSSVAPRHRR